MTTTTSSGDSPATRRAKRERRRRIGAGLVLAGVVAASLAVFAIAVVEYDVFTSAGLVGCGSAINPVAGRESLCASALREPTVIGIGFAVLAIGLMVGGVVLRARTPRPLSF